MIMGSYIHLFKQMLLLPTEGIALYTDIGTLIHLKTFYAAKQLLQGETSGKLCAMYPTTEYVQDYYICTIY